MRNLARLSLLILLCACGGVDSVDDHEPGTTDELIGAPCASNADCVEGCYLDTDDFPGGFCSIACTSDADCPADAVCAAKSGGMCLFACPAFDCGYLGPGYRCDSKDRIAGGETPVCIGD